MLMYGNMPASNLQNDSGVGCSVFQKKSRLLVKLPDCLLMILSHQRSDVIEIHDAITETQCQRWKFGEYSLKITQR